MPIYQPTPEMMYNAVNANSLSLSMTVLVAGVLSQVESTIELTNRICDRYLQPVRQYAAIKEHADCANSGALKSTPFFPALF